MSDGRRKTVEVIEEDHGDVLLTGRELEYIILVTDGLFQQGATGRMSNAVAQKVSKATGWTQMRRTQMLCRFAYKHGLVRL